MEDERQPFEPQPGPIAKSILRMIEGLPESAKGSPHAAIALNLAVELDSMRLGAPASAAKELRECLKTLEADLSADDTDFVNNLAKTRRKAG